MVAGGNYVNIATLRIVNTTIVAISMLWRESGSCNILAT